MKRKNVFMVLILALLFGVQAYGGVAPQAWGNDITDQAAGLHWNQPSGAVGYRVYKINEGAADTRIATIEDASVTHYNLTGLTPATSSKYSVTAGYIVGGNLVESAYSNIVDVNTTHNWEGVLFDCLNGTSNPPTKTELEAIIEFTCQEKELTTMAPIEDLSNIEILDLFHNHIGGEIPGWIYNKTSLSYLNLNNNRFTGNIAVGIGNLKNLTYLGLLNSQLIGTIPAEIKNLQNLSYLNLSHNQLIGTIPTEIWNLKNLTSLYLNSNQLEGSIPVEIKNLENLLHLVLGDNQFTGNVPVEIWNMTKLEVLDLGYNEFTVSSISGIQYLPHLHYLDLSSCNLTGAIPKEILKLPNLISLYLRSNQLTGNIPAEIGNLQNLQRLILNDNQLTGNIPVEIANLSSLSNLELQNNNLTGSIPTGIALLPIYLLRLYNNCNLYTDDPGLQAFIDSTPSIFDHDYQYILDTNHHDCNIFNPSVLMYILD